MKSYVQLMATRTLNCTIVFICRLDEGRLAVGWAGLKPPPTASTVLDSLLIFLNMKEMKKWLVWRWFFLEFIKGIRPRPFNINQKTRISLQCIVSRIPAPAGSRKKAKQGEPRPVKTNVQIKERTSSYTRLLHIKILIQRFPPRRPRNLHERKDSTIVAAISWITNLQVTGRLHVTPLVVYGSHNTILASSCNLSMTAFSWSFSTGQRIAQLFKRPRILFEDDLSPFFL